MAVQVLNDKVETFDTTPVNVTLQSDDGTRNVLFSAYTCPRQITEKKSVMDWRRYQSRWPHLRVCSFREPAKDLIVDVLIGLDLVDLHYWRCDVKGGPGEPMGRLGPLSWSVIGSPELVSTEKIVAF